MSAKHKADMLNALKMTENGHDIVGLSEKLLSVHIAGPR
jgi:hypothetical protein